MIQCAISTSSERTSIETPDGTQRFTKSHDKIKKLYTSVLLENLQYNGGVEYAADEVAVPVRSAILYSVIAEPLAFARAVISNTLLAKVHQGK